MATRTVVCPECAEPLPYGRLACPACGALLASVAGVARPSERLEAPAPQDDEQPLVADDGPLSPADREPDDAGAVTDGHGATEGADRNEQSVQAWETREPVAAAPAPAPGAPSWPPTEPSWPEPASGAPGWPEPAPTTPSWPEPTPAPTAESNPSWHEPPPAAPEPATAPSNPSWPEPAPTTSGPAAPTPGGYMPAGAYMPPSAVFAPEPSPEVRAPRPGSASLLADLPLVAPDDLAGWLVASGAAVATVGFFLPWAHRLIAAPGDGYVNAWGLGAPMHLPVFAAAVATLVLAVRPNRVPGWLRAGVLPLVLGGLLLGLAWPYVFVGPLRGQFGSVLEALAGVILVVGGILALRLDRHSGSRRPV